MSEDIPNRKPVSTQIFGDNKAPVREVLEADFGSLKAEVDAMVEKASAMNRQIKSEAEQAAVGNLIVDLRHLWKRADALRAEEKKPIYEAGKELDGWFKDILADAVSVGTDLQNHADAFVRKREAEARAKAAEEAAAARRKAEAERLKAEAAKTPKSASAAEARAEAQEAAADQFTANSTAKTSDLTRSRVGGVTSSARGAWKAQITDYQATIKPLDELGPFLKRPAIEAALNSMVKTQEGGANWPGVRFYQEQKATFRR